MIVAFDLDDTLYMELDFVKSGANAIARAVAEKTRLTVEAATELIRSNKSLSDAIDELAKIATADGISLSVKELVNIYRFHRPTINLRNGAKELLDKIKSKNHLIAIITDGRAATQRNKIDALGLYRWVAPENIIISEDVGGDKHTPLPFQALLHKHSDEDSICYIADNPAKDFYYPNQMGWHTIMIKNDPDVGIHPQTVNTDREYAPDFIISNLAEAMEIIEKL